MTEQTGIITLATITLGMMAAVLQPLIGGL